VLWGVLCVFRAVCAVTPLQAYKAAGQQTVILAGAEYGSGSSRDWAAKGPYLQVSPLKGPLGWCCSCA